MSTDFTIIEHDGCAIVLDERSSRFDLDFEYPDTDPNVDSYRTLLRAIPPAEIVKMACRALLAASYHLDEAEFDRIIGKEFKQYAPGSRFASCMPAVRGEIPCP